MPVTTMAMIGIPIGPPVIVNQLTSVVRTCVRLATIAFSTGWSKPAMPLLAVTASCTSAKPHPGTMRTQGCACPLGAADRRRDDLAGGRVPGLRRSNEDGPGQAAAAPPVGT